MANERFERIPPSLSPKVLRHRSGGPADFLARLWTRFGPPDQSDGGFRYDVRDRTTGLSFTAYSGASGPAYRGDPDDTGLEQVLDVFDRWIDEAPLADCYWLVNDGCGEWGAKDGIAFERARAADQDPLVDTLTKAEALDYATASRETVFEMLWKLRDERDRNPVAARALRERIRRIGVALWERLFTLFEAEVAEAHANGDRQALTRLFDGEWWQLELGSDVGLPAALEPRIRALERIGADVPRRIQMSGPAKFAICRSPGTPRRPRQ